MRTTTPKTLFLVLLGILASSAAVAVTGDRDDARAHIAGAVSTSEAATSGISAADTTAARLRSGPREPKTAPEYPELLSVVSRHGFGNGDGRVDEIEARLAADALGVTPGDRIDPEDITAVVAAHNRWVERQRTVVFATAGGVDIHSPSQDALLAGFHQASYAGSYPMVATGTGHPTTTLPSRGRSTDRHSAVDVALPEGEAVRAPVTGRVVSARNYSLYGRYADSRIEVVTASGRTVKILHVTGLQVAVGEHVVGGQTVIADTATLFPFESQIERHAGRHPHIHIEVW